MGTDYSEKAGDYIKTFSKPLAAVIDLNLKTMRELSEHTDIVEKLTQAKKPEEFISAQVELAKITTMKTMEYFQALYDIGMKTLTQAGASATNLARTATDNIKKTSESARPSKL